MQIKNFFFLIILIEVIFTILQVEVLKDFCVAMCLKKRKLTWTTLSQLFLFEGF